MKTSLEKRDQFCLKMFVKKLGKIIFRKLNLIKKIKV